MQEGELIQLMVATEESQSARSTKLKKESESRHRVAIEAEKVVGGAWTGGMLRKAWWDFGWT